MCGRFTLSYSDYEDLAAELGVPAESFAEYRPRFNIAPTDDHWIVRMKLEDRELLPAKWGLVNWWAKDAKTAARQINARAETLTGRPAFREAFAERRCAVPADGFFEWEGTKDHRRPLWYHRPDGGLLLFAGLYESWQPKPGQWQRTFTIITTTPNDLIRPIHDRMPVVLPPSAVDQWLDSREPNPARLLDLLRPAPEDMLVARYVSPLANSVKNDEPAVLEEAPRLL